MKMTVVDREPWWTWVWNNITYFFRNTSPEARQSIPDENIQNALQNFIEVITSEDIPPKPDDDDPLDPYILIGCGATGKTKLFYKRRSQKDEVCPYC